MTANASNQEVAKRGIIIRPLASDILEEKIELAFDHLRIVLDAVERVRVELEVSDIATAFVGTTFTMAELRAVYEATWGVQLAAANLRGRPAELYRGGRAWKHGTPSIGSSADERK